MKLRLWPRHSEPAVEDVALEPPPEPEPEPSVAPEPAPPRKLSLTLDEAKDAIRVAKGDVIQVGFLAAEYQRQQRHDPQSAETRAARARLCNLIAKRLRDRKLLAPDGTFELRESA